MTSADKVGTDVVASGRDCMVLFGIKFSEVPFYLNLTIKSRQYLLLLFYKKKKRQGKMRENGKEGERQKEK